MRCSTTLAVLAALTGLAGAPLALLAADEANQPSLLERMESRAQDVRASGGRDATASVVARALKEEIARQLATKRSVEAADQAFDSELLDAYRYVFRLHPTAENFARLEAAYGQAIENGESSAQLTAHFIDDAIAARRFSQAHGLAVDNAIPSEDMPTADFRVDAAARNLSISWQPEREEWQLEEIRLPAGTFVVVVASPACPFSLAAASDIQADQQLAQVFSRRSLWVMPQSDKLVVARFDSWRARHATFPFAAAYDQSSWAVIPRWDAVPAFHVFRDGKLKERLVGWPSPDRVDELRAALAP